jgi:aromatic ring-opening dioxygenase LigB subunit
VAQEADRVGMLVMGDGSACRSTEGPGYLDPRAEPFDAEVVEALRAGDPAGLLAIDPALAADLQAAGRAAWQVLAGASEEVLFDAEVAYDAAPYGVGYMVAVWERHG